MCVCVCVYDNWVLHVGCWLDLSRCISGALGLSKLVGGSGPSLKPQELSRAHKICSPLVKAIEI